MELWKDYQASSFYVINKTTGEQASCNKFGSIPSSFKPYATGYNSQRPYDPVEADSNYRVQPKKFDGYFQCPRPSSHITEVRRPYTSTTKRYIAKRLADDVTKLPKPVPSLTFSKVYSPLGSPVLQKKLKNLKTPDSKTLTIEEVKRALVLTPSKNVKTAELIIENNFKEKEAAKGYQVPPVKIDRRKMKGVFTIDFPTSHDLFKKEREVWEKTNPVATEQQKKAEITEYKNLKRRREQKILKNKLIEGN